MRRSRWPIVIVLVLSLALSGVARQLTLGQRERHDLLAGTSAGKSANLGKLNSFALGLVLGGLRGPLVIILWTSSEDQKSSHNLQDFDSKVELIRQLQPEFVTVHLFQIWNKAYNISVLMANLPNKYTTILDALSYASAVDKERPDDINIMASIAGIYFDKYGNSNEKEYYRARLRDESRAEEERARVSFPAAKKQDVAALARLFGADSVSLNTRDEPGSDSRLYVTLRNGVVAPARERLLALGATITSPPDRKGGNAGNGESVRATKHAVLLDSSGNILPPFLSARITPGPQGYNGSPLYFLKKFEPFPYGVSPNALGYAYYKRGQWLQEVQFQRHAQLSSRVISSRAALTLQKWGDEEDYRGRRAEAEAFGLVVPKEEADLDQVGAKLPLAPPKEITPAFNEAVFSYERARAICEATLEEFAHHTDVYSIDVVTYVSHRSASALQAQLMAADRDFLKATIAAGDERTQLARAALDNYEQAADGYTRHLLQFFVPDEESRQVLPPGVDRRPELLARMSRPELNNAFLGLRRLTTSQESMYGNFDDVNEIGAYIIRARLRADTLRPFAAPVR